MTRPEPITTDRAPCAGCPVATDRRDFVRQALIGVASVVATLGSSRGAGALPVGDLVARGREGRSVTYPVPAGDGVSIDRAHDVILARSAGAVYAFSLACPHQNTALRWLARDHRFQCPKHQSKYAPDGAFLDGRATRAMDRFPLRIEGDAIVVETATLIRRDVDPAGWTAAVVHVEGGA